MFFTTDIPGPLSSVVLTSVNKYNIKKMESVEKDRKDEPTVINCLSFACFSSRLYREVKIVSVVTKITGGVTHLLKYI